MKALRQFVLPISGQTVTLREINYVVPTRKNGYDVQISWQDGYGDEHAIELDCKDLSSAKRIFQCIKENAY